MNLTSANIHAAAEAHSYNGLLSVLEGLPLTNDSRWKILFVLQHYEQYVRLICNSLRSAVGLIEANPQLYAYALKDFEHDYSDISDIIEVIEDENGVDTASADGRVYPTVIGSQQFHRSHRRIRRHPHRLLCRARCSCHRSFRCAASKKWITTKRFESLRTKTE